MRKYKNITNGGIATMEKRPEGYGFYNNGHIIVTAKFGGYPALARVGSYADGMAWLMREFNGGWVKVRD